MKTTRHARNSAIPGRTLCGLQQFSTSVKFAQSHKDISCQECVDTIKRIAPTRSAHASAQYKARRKQILSNPDRPRGKYPT